MLRKQLYREGHGANQMLNSYYIFGPNIFAFKENLDNQKK